MPEVVIRVEDSWTERYFDIREDMDDEDYDRLVDAGDDFFEEMCKYLGERLLISLGRA